MLQDYYRTNSKFFIVYTFHLNLYFYAKPRIVISKAIFLHVLQSFTGIWYFSKEVYKKNSKFKISNQNLSYFVFIKVLFVSMESTNLTN